MIVCYARTHVPAWEWVFNGADIDHAKIVWARDMGAEQNLELVRYFSQRKAWMVEPDQDPAKLSPAAPDCALRN